jgi:hypothetical protein
MSALKTHSFSLILDNVETTAANFEDRFFEAGCNDALISIVKGCVTLDFDREAKNLLHAIASAIRDVSTIGARVLRITPDPMVSISDIAERAETTRQAVSLWALGKRGPGDFPAPIARVDSDMPLWDWSSVARWLYVHEKLEDPSLIVEASLISYANDAITFAASSSAKKYQPLAAHANLTE